MTSASDAERKAVEFLGDLIERARAAGVDVTYEAWEDMSHGWHGNSDVLPEALDAIAAIGAFFQRKVAA